MGLKRDLKVRKDKRQYFGNLVQQARNLIYKKVTKITGAAVNRLLKPTLSVPTVVSHYHSCCLSFLTTVETLLTHTPRWRVQAMGYERLWVIRVRFGWDFGFGGPPKVWVIREYGLSEVWVMGVSTVILWTLNFFPTHHVTPSDQPNNDNTSESAPESAVGLFCGFKQSETLEKGSMSFRYCVALQSLIYSNSCSCKCWNQAGLVAHVNNNLNLS